MIHRDCINGYNGNDISYSNNPEDYYYTYDEVRQIFNIMINELNGTESNPYMAASNTSGNNFLNNFLFTN